MRCSNFKLTYDTHATVDFISHSVISLTSSSIMLSRNDFVRVHVKLLKAAYLIVPSRSSHTNNNNVILTLNNLLDIKFHQFCVAAWMLKALMAKMLISELIKGKEQYLGCHGWLLSCRGSVVCFEALIMAAQTYNYELSEVRKLLEMNRQRETRLLEGTYRSLFLTHSDDGRWK